MRNTFLRRLISSSTELGKLSTSTLKVLDGKRAIEYARKGCELTKWQDMDYLDTLAAAYAEDGDFQNAIEWGKGSQTPQVCKDSKVSNEAKQQLDLYIKGQKYRTN